MSDIYTKVRGGVGYACLGRKTRSEAIAEARACYEHTLREAQEFLATPDDQLEVKVIRGLHREQLIEELKP